MNPIEYMWDRLGCRINKQNDVDTLEDLGRALVNEWNNLEPQFLRNWSRACEDVFVSCTSNAEGMLSTNGAQSVNAEQVNFNGIY